MPSHDDFSATDYWKALILYGLNQATYKIALGKTLLSLSAQGYNRVSWDILASEFFELYRSRLDVADPLPQQATPGRRTAMERIVANFRLRNDIDTAVGTVQADAFDDVIPRFHNLAGIESIQGKFYRFEFGRTLELTDELHMVREKQTDALHAELDARWGLLEGAFLIATGEQRLANDVRSIYLDGAYKRRTLTGNIPFLQGYQGNTCFYCGLDLRAEDIDVDHVLPRQVLQHDEIWNLVLAHRACNIRKLDRLVGAHFIRKLIGRNENIMGSNHPWKKRIADMLGSSPTARAKKLHWHYENVKMVLGTNYWGGSEGYNPQTDPFYQRLITRLNNRG
ncbi:HNH endonuclease domain-containing protein [Massilia sp.]|uniref:HNH endonuclease n=1 Tax=Massilia sp. TaxID=1882437 RepID=UPI0028AD2E12|nr:HNH endonuclease domain-containing protein [Massilia sp.]